MYASPECAKYFRSQVQKAQPACRYLTFPQLEVGLQSLPDVTARER